METKFIIFCAREMKNGQQFHWSQCTYFSKSSVKWPFGFPRNTSMEHIKAILRDPWGFANGSACISVLHCDQWNWWVCKSTCTLFSSVRDKMSGGPSAVCSVREISLSLEGHFVKRTFSPSPDILDPCRAFHYKMSSKYQTSFWPSICWTLSLIYPHWTFCPARSNPFARHFSKCAGHVWRVRRVSRTLQSARHF